MTLKKSMLLVLLIAGGFTAVYAQSRATSKAELIKTGIAFYSEGKYAEAAGLLRLAGNEPEALYWLSLSELSAGNYDSALSSMDALENAGSGGRWSADLPYHRGRCYYYLGRYGEAESSLKSYAEHLSDSDPRKASAYYWLGEALFAGGQLDSAAGVFSTVVKNYPNSAKYEASYYRLNFINQKKIEGELLGMLKWSHEESLKSIEEYQEREKNYEAAIAEYQQRLGELLAGEGSAAARIPEADFADFAAPRGEHAGHLSSEERSVKIQELKSSVLELSGTLTTMLGGAE